MAEAGLSRRDGLFILAGVIGAGCVWSGLQLNPKRLFRQLADQGALVHEFDAAAVEVLKETLRGSPLANRYRVNQTPGEGSANVLIFSARALSQQAAYGGIALKSAGCLLGSPQGLCAKPRNRAQKANDPSAAWRLVDPPVRRLIFREL